jgi:hypothetical protein
MTLKRLTDDERLGPVRSQAPVPWKNLDWQRLWLATQAKPWRSLAIVPATSELPDTFSVTIAENLARTGMTHLGTPIRAIDATRIPLSDLIDFTNEMERVLRFGELVLVAVTATAHNPVAVALAQAADAAVLCVVLDMKAKEAERTVDLVGRSRFIGTLLADVGTSPSLQPDPKKKKKK